MPKSPHLLAVGSNCRKIRNNLVTILDPAAIAAIDQEIAENVSGLYRFGVEHFTFAKGLPKSQWRQRVSRLYYGAYNVSRSVRLAHDGHYSTDPAEHKKVDSFPDAFPNKSTYSNKLVVLRDDRNVCDYDHTANATDLILPPDDAEKLVADLIIDAQAFLTAQGFLL